MSIQAQILEHVRVGMLAAYRPIGPDSGKPIRRRLYLSQSALKDLNDEPIRMLVGLGPVYDRMTHWVLGGRIYAENRKGTFLKRLDPPPPEIWAIRVTVPIVRARLFTRFAAPDTLIMTNLHTRGYLGGRGSKGRRRKPRKPQGWGVAMKRCEAEWDLLFPNIAPFSGRNVHEYITENCDDFDI